MALFVLRLIVGGLLFLGVWNDIVSDQGMEHFVQVLRRYDFPVPEVMAQLSVWAQFTAGLAFVFGLFTRWAAVLCVINYAVALVMIDHLSGVRGSFPSVLLVALGLYLAVRGAGRFSLDRLFEAPGSLDQEPDVSPA